MLYVYQGSEYASDLNSYLISMTNLLWENEKEAAS